MIIIIVIIITTTTITTANTTTATHHHDHLFTSGVFGSLQATVEAHVAEMGW
jgi:hypothetical protein